MLLSLEKMVEMQVINKLKNLIAKEGTGKCSQFLNPLLWLCHPHLIKVLTLLQATMTSISRP